MGFVKDHRAHIGQNAGIGRVFGLLLDAKIGEEQVMIDDDDVALGSAAAHPGDEALFPDTALLPETGVSPGVKFVPQRAGFRQGRYFSAIAGFGGLLPIADRSIVLNLFQTTQNRLIG